jgi:hypothetical protein
LDKAIELGEGSLLDLELLNEFKPYKLWMGECYHKTRDELVSLYEIQERMNEALKTRERELPLNFIVS